MIFCVAFFGVEILKASYFHWTMFHIRKYAIALVDQCI
jgi:hypothetical protein